MKRKKQKPLLPQTAREHCRQIFGDVQPPSYVWEKEFDYCDEGLQALARKDWKQINSHELGVYYVLNLVYVEPLQPELFNYLFPIYLAIWSEELISSSEYFYHHEIHNIFSRPYIWQEMMDAKQRAAVYAFMVDSVLKHLQSERGFVYSTGQTPDYFWLDEFNELGHSSPIIEPIWQRWWQLDHPGKAVSALMYASCLIYEEHENPLFPAKKGKSGGRVPELVLPTLKENRLFLQQVLTAEFILTKTQQAAALLAHEPEGALAQRIAADALQRQELIEVQIELLQ